MKPIDFTPVNKIIENYFLSYTKIPLSGIELKLDVKKIEAFDLNAIVGLFGKLTGRIFVSIEYGLMSRLAEILLPGIERTRLLITDLTGEFVNNIAGNIPQVIPELQFTHTTPRVYSLMPEFIPIKSKNVVLIEFKWEGKRARIVVDCDIKD